MIPKPPCLNCKEREPGCHSKCEKYISFRAEKDRINEINNKERIANADIYRTKKYKK